MADLSNTILILAHGSGQAANSPWMEQLAALLEAADIQTHRFNFEYMDAALKAGKPRPPARMPKLLEEFESQLEQFRGRRMFVGGKSLGGRVASHLATKHKLSGVVAFGYPFHPPRRPEKLRTEHLSSLLCPMLILQGERDPFGKRAEVEGYKLPSRVKVHWLGGGDHQLEPLKKHPATLESNLQSAVEQTAIFMASN